MADLACQDNLWKLVCLLRVIANSFLSCLNGQTALACYCGTPVFAVQISLEITSDKTPASSFELPNVSRREVKPGSFTLHAEEQRAIATKLVSLLAIGSTKVDGVLAGESMARRLL